MESYIAFQMSFLKNSKILRHSLVRVYLVNYILITIKQWNNDRKADSITQ
jgi:hypothetical protein